MSQIVSEDTKSNLQRLWALLNDEKYQEVIDDATKLLNSLVPEVSIDANKLLGMAFFRQNKYAESVPFFEVVAANSNDVSAWFNIVTSATLSGDVQKGEAAFNKATQIQINDGYQQQPSVSFMRHYYACALRDIGEYERALAQINELRTIYEQLKITDSTFVYIRGVPFLSHFMDLAIDVFNGLGKNFNAESWISEFSEKLDEEGQEYLAEVKVKLFS
jgi:tetratricopeptide (TPR) repeat protein